MILSGGLLVWLTSFIGWKGLFLVMGLIALIPLIYIFFYKEGEKFVIEEKKESLKELFFITLSTHNCLSLIQAGKTIFWQKEGHAASFFKHSIWSHAVNSKPSH